MKSSYLMLMLGITTGCSWLAHSPAEAPENYTMRVTQQCFCHPQFSGPFDIEIRQGAPYRAVRSSDGKAIPLSWVGNEVPDLAVIMRRIQQAEAQAAYQLEINWSDEAGIPSSVYIDRSEMIADDEVTYRIENFQRL
ncbi:DUF6174 domain-containing protein [Bacterioplanoides sp.]|uniref:DUF6174 domain-containing protein n=1 Tax=Bacterioplanoides sp. TaxID=2066072 RepID=UPI003B0011EB